MAPVKDAQEFTRRRTEKRPYTPAVCRPGIRLGVTSLTRRPNRGNTMICLAACLGSVLLGAIAASIATSLFLAARHDLDGQNRPGA
jgi:hypothetical protein